MVDPALQQVAQEFDLGAPLDKRAFYPTFIKAVARILFGRLLLDLESGQQTYNGDNRAAMVNNMYLIKKSGGGRYTGANE